MRPFYHKVNINGIWICQFVELLISFVMLSKRIKSFRYLTTNASLCSSSETVRELSLADNGKNNGNS